MTLTNKDIRRIFVSFMLLVLVVAAFLIVKPIVLSIIGGLILAYIFTPVYRRTYRLIRERNTSAILMCLIALIILVVPLWLFIPIIVEQVFEMFNVTQNIDFSKIIQAIFPSSQPAFQEQLTTVIIKFVGNIASSTINILIGFIQNIPQVLLHI